MAIHVQYTTYNNTFLLYYHHEQSVCHIANSVTRPIVSFDRMMTSEQLTHPQDFDYLKCYSIIIIIVLCTDSRLCSGTSINVHVTSL